jgi:hypothetical protein
MPAAMHPIPRIAPSLRRARSATRALLAAAALGALSTSTLPAQAAPAAPHDSAPPRAPSAVGSFGVRAGDRVRLTLTDTLVQLRGGRPVGAHARVEGTLVALDSPGVEVRLVDGLTITFPPDAVRTLEARVGAGPCARSRRARAVCTVGGLLAGTAVGALAGGRIGRDVSGLYAYNDPVAERRRWRLRGAAGGAALALALVPVLGRDQWAPVSAWPAAPGP